MFERTLAELSGVRRGEYAGLAALEAGKPTDPAALFLPGFTGSKEDFLGILPPLAAAGYHAVAVDLRGQYESPGPDAPEAYLIPTLSAEVGAAVDELAGDPVHVVGHSFGGLVARDVVIGRPSLAASLTLMGSGPAAIPPPRAIALNLMRPVLAEGGLPAVWKALRSADPTEYPPEVLDFLERRFFAGSAVGLQSIGEQLLVEPDRVPELASVAAAANIPILVTHGEGDDAWAPGIQVEMAARLGATYEVIPGAEHSPAWQNPDDTAAVLLRFWSDVAARRAA